MRGVPVLGAVIIGAVALAGCGQQYGGTGGGAAASPSGPAAVSPSSPGASSPGGSARSLPPSSPGTPVAAATGVPVAAACGGGSATRGRLTITNANSGDSFCVKTGTNIVVYLKGSVAHRWGRIFATSPVLRPVPNGALALMIGVTGASFLAARPGTAYIDSSRPVCGPDASTGAGNGGDAMVCDAILNFRVSVTVVR